MKLHKRDTWEKTMLGKESIGKENCPFCNIKQEDKKLIIWEGKYWRIKHNKYPYNGLNNHLMAVSKKHKEHTKDLSKAEFGELKEVSNFMNNYYGEQNYFSFIRETNGGKSIKHLHYHYLPGTLYACDLEKIITKAN